MRKNYIPKTPFEQPIVLEEIKANEIKPKVSIVIPVYNVEKYIKLCVDSVINQTLKDIQIICVDDGSKDNCGNILDDYAAKDSRITVIHQPNGGYGKAMNVGFSIAKGEYIGIVESDDFVSENMFEELYDCAIKNNLDFVKSDYMDFAHDATIDDIKTNYVKILASPQFYNKVLCPSEELKIFSSGICTWSGIYKNEFIRSNNIFHNETPGASYQDNGFYFQTFAYAKKAYFLNKAFYKYRRDNPNSSVANKGKVYCTRDEFDFILEELNKRPEIKEKVITAYWMRRFKSYYFTYLRIAEEFKEEYIAHIVEVFRKPYDDGLIDISLFTEIEWIRLNSMLKKPYRYRANEIARRNVMVSVVIPVYNAEEYLSNCLDSILSQTLKNIEIICVDDGSSDKSLSILDSYEDKDCRITVLAQQNKGAAIARNNGMKMCSGEFIAYMDADDYYPSNIILETLYNNAKNHNVKISGGSMSELRDGKIITTYEGLIKKQVFQNEGLKSFTDHQIAYGYVCFIYNRRMLFDNNIFFPNYRRFQDPPFFVKAMICAKDFYAVKEPVYVYRCGHKDIVWSPEKTIDMLKGMNDVLLMSRQNNLIELHNFIVATMDFQVKKSQIDANISASNPVVLRLLMRFNKNISQSYLKKSSYFKNTDDYVIAPIKRLQDTLSAQKKEIIKVTEENAKLKKDLLVLQKQPKPGRFYLFITYIPRKFVGLIKCIKEHGLKYTFYRIGVHLKLKNEEGIN